MPGEWTPERDAELLERMSRWGNLPDGCPEADIRDLRAEWLATVGELMRVRQAHAETTTRANSLREARILAAIGLGASTVEGLVDDADDDAVVVEAAALCNALDAGADREDVRDAVARLVRAALGLAQLGVPRGE